MNYFSKKTIKRNSSSLQSGATLLEALLVITILLAGSAFAVQQMLVARENARSTNEGESLKELVGGVYGLFGSRSSFQGLSVAEVIAENAVPERMIREGELFSSFRTPINIEPRAFNSMNNGAFAVVYSQLNSRRCINLANSHFGGTADLLINGSSVVNATTRRVDSLAVIQRCSSSPVNTVDFVYVGSNANAGEGGGIVLNPTPPDVIIDPSRPMPTGYGTGVLPESGAPIVPPPPGVPSNPVLSPAPIGTGPAPTPIPTPPIGTFTPVPLPPGGFESLPPIISVPRPFDPPCANETRHSTVSCSAEGLGGSGTVRKEEVVDSCSRNVLSTRYNQVIGCCVTGQNETQSFSVFSATINGCIPCSNQTSSATSTCQALGTAGTGSFFGTQLRNNCTGVVVSSTWVSQTNCCVPGRVSTQSFNIAGVNGVLGCNEAITSTCSERGTGGSGSFSGTRDNSDRSVTWQSQSGCCQIGQPAAQTSTVSGVSDIPGCNETISRTCSEAGAAGNGSFFAIRDNNTGTILQHISQSGCCVVGQPSTSTSTVSGVSGVPGCNENVTSTCSDRGVLDDAELPGQGSFTGTLNHATGVFLWVAQSGCCNPGRNFEQGFTIDSTGNVPGCLEGRSVSCSTAGASGPGAFIRRYDRSTQTWANFESQSGCCVSGQPESSTFSMSGVPGVPGCEVSLTSTCGARGISDDAVISGAGSFSGVLDNGTGLVSWMSQTGCCRPGAPYSEPAAVAGVSGVLGCIQPITDSCVAGGASGSGSFSGTLDRATNTRTYTSNSGCCISGQPSTSSFTRSGLSGIPGCDELVSSSCSARGAVGPGSFSGIRNNETGVTTWNTQVNCCVSGQAFTSTSTISGVSGVRGCNESITSSCSSRGTSRGSSGTGLFSGTRNNETGSVVWSSQSGCCVSGQPSTSSTTVDGVSVPGCNTGVSSTCHARGAVGPGSFSGFEDISTGIVTWVTQANCCVSGQAFSSTFTVSGVAGLRGCIEPVSSVCSSFGTIGSGSFSGIRNNESGVTVWSSQSGCCVAGQPTSSSFTMSGLPGVPGCNLAVTSSCSARGAAGPGSFSGTQNNGTGITTWTSQSNCCVLGQSSAVQSTIAGLAGVPGCNEGVSSSCAAQGISGSGAFTGIRNNSTGVTVWTAQSGCCRPGFSSASFATVNGVSGVPGCIEVISSTCSARGVAGPGSFSGSRNNETGVITWLSQSGCCVSGQAFSSTQTIDGVTGVRGCIEPVSSSCSAIGAIGFGSFSGNRNNATGVTTWISQSGCCMSGQHFSGSFSLVGVSGIPGCNQPVTSTCAARGAAGTGSFSGVRNNGTGVTEWSSQSGCCAPGQPSTNVSTISGVAGIRGCNTSVSSSCSAHGTIGGGSFFGTNDASTGITTWAWQSGCCVAGQPSTSSFPVAGVAGVPGCRASVSSTCAAQGASGSGSFSGTRNNATGVTTWISQSGCCMPGQPSTSSFPVAGVAGVPGCRASVSSTCSAQGASGSGSFSGTRDNATGVTTWNSASGCCAPSFPSSFSRSISGVSLTGCDQTPLLTPTHKHAVASNSVAEIISRNYISLAGIALEGSGRLLGANTRYAHPSIWFEITPTNEWLEPDNVAVGSLYEIRANVLWQGGYGPSIHNPFVSYDSCAGEVPPSQWTTLGSCTRFFYVFAGLDHADGRRGGKDVLFNVEIRHRASGLIVESENFRVTAEAF